MAHKIFRKEFKLRDGNTLSLFFNPENNLLVADKLRKDGLGGNEFVRVDVSKVSLPTKKELSEYGTQV